METQSRLTIKPQSEKAILLFLWLAITSIAMLFAGLTSGYIVRRTTGNWLKFELPYTFWFSTALIILSSVTMNMASQAVKAGKYASLVTYTGFTGLLGIGFLISQIISWKLLINEKIFFTGIESSASGSYLYVISALHFTHIMGGLIAMTTVYFNARKRKYSPDNYIGVKLCATFWHFLDGLWVYLFLFMLIER